MEANHPKIKPIKYPYAEIIFNTPKIKIAVDMAIEYAGATGHFVIPGTPVTDISPATRPLVIYLPDGETIKSTHT